MRTLRRSDTQFLLKSCSQVRTAEVTRNSATGCSEKVMSPACGAAFLTPHIRTGYSRGQALQPLQNTQGHCVAVMIQFVSKCDFPQWKIWWWEESVCSLGQRRIVFPHSGQVVAWWLSNSSLLAQLPPAHFYALTTGGSQQLMRHFISRSLIMAELQPRQEVEPELLNGDDLNEDREDADTSESVKRKRRKKKRSKTSASGKRHHFAVRESLRKIAHKCPPFIATRCIVHEHQTCRGRLFNLSPGNSCPDVPTPSGSCWSWGCSSGNGMVSEKTKKSNLPSKGLESCHLKIWVENNRFLLQIKGALVLSCKSLKDEWNDVIEVSTVVVQ